jgi:hypothetical protein
MAVQDGTWVQSWDWNAPNWENLTDDDTTAVGWMNGPGMPAEAQAFLDQFIAGLASGEINVWTGPINANGRNACPGRSAAATRSGACRCCWKARLVRC